MSDRALLRKQHLLIFLTVLIDLIGFGILIPILQPLGKEFGAPDWALAILMGIYSFMQFLFAPVLGKISDRVGRRPVILASLVGSMLGYLLIASAGMGGMSTAVSLSLIFTARVVTGICGASFSTAQAYLADITAPEKRAGVMGMIGAAFGLGFMIGPVIGGISSHYGGRATPFLIAAGLSLLNLVLAWKNLPESLPPEKRGHAPAHRPSLWHAVQAAQGTPFQRLLLANFLVITSFAMMTTCFILFTVERFGFKDIQNGMVFFFIGLIAVFIQGGLIRRMKTAGRERQIAMVGIILMSISLALLPLTNPWATLLIVTAIMSVGNSLATPMLNTLASLCGTASTQGSTLGAMSGAGSLGRFVGPFLTGPLLSIDPAHYGRAALWVSSGLMLVALVTVIGLKVTRNVVAESAAPGAGEG